MTTEQELQPPSAASWPTATAFKDAPYVTLAFAPRTDAAKALTDAATAAALPYETMKRSLGPAGLVTRTSQIGAILADVIRSRRKGRVVSAQRRPGGGGWAHSVFGCDAFWGRVGALEGAGLVDVQVGVKTAKTLLAAFTGLYGGLPSRVWATDRLMQMADEYGLSAAEPKADWQLSAAFFAKRITVPPAEAVTVRTWDEKAEPTDLPTGQEIECERFRTWMVELNDACTAAHIGGCLQPAFRRNFVGDVRLGGRLHALGPYNFQTMAGADRIGGITIDGQHVAEIDLHAAQLTIFLALTGARELPEGDLYTFPGIPRDAAKAWFMQTFGAGRLCTQWGDKVSLEVLLVKPRAVREAALQRYPALADLLAVLPPDLRSRLPKSRLGWAVGQHLVNWESRIVYGAIGQLWKVRGVLALPMHDALIVRRSDEKAGERALSDAFFVLLKLRPRITVDSGMSASIEGAKLQPSA